ncbi:hypothetical protein AB3331_11245, partial [Streptococcus sp. H49]|uniref:hypothetical protein n=1 Tax=Streptococcus huangxiaojuni TaxID=3237239 RepID=UPI0034A3F5CF
IISLSNPSSSDITTPLSEAKKVLTDTKSNMETFNGWTQGTEFSELLASQGTILASLSELIGVSYTDADASAFYSDASFADGVKTIAQGIASSTTPVVLLNSISNSIKQFKNDEKADDSNSWWSEFKEIIGSVAKDKTTNFFKATKDKIFKEGKNIGRSWAAKLQPRSSLGTFVKDNNKIRKGVSGYLRKVTPKFSKAIGWGSRIGIGALVALDYYSEFKDYNDTYHNTGRAVAYSAIAGTAGVVAGLAVGAAFSGPVIGTLAAVGAGYAVSKGIRTLYENCTPFKNTVDSVGDGLSKATNDIGNCINGAFSSLKGAFT